MSDIINDYFKRFYPKDWDDLSRYDYTSMLGGMNSYRQDYKNYVEIIFPRIICADDFSISVQAHNGSYSAPRDDFASKYSKVECGFPTIKEELLLPYMDGDPETDDPTESVYGYVPIDVVIAVINKHGGIKR